MSGISLTASFFIVTLNLFQGLIREMLESIVGENEPKAKLEPYGTNEPSEMLKQVQHDTKEGKNHVPVPVGTGLQDDSKKMTLLN